MTETAFEYRVISILSMYDGDSVNVKVLRQHEMPEVLMDFGFNDIVINPAYTVQKMIDVSVRMYGYDTPELRDKRPDWKKAAYLARDVARNWMEDGIEKKSLIMKSYKDKTGKYGRYLANFVKYDDQKDRNKSISLGDYLIANYMAVEYYGQSKADIEAAHHANIEQLKTEGMI